MTYRCLHLNQTNASEDRLTGDSELGWLCGDELSWGGCADVGARVLRPHRRDDEEAAPVVPGAASRQQTVLAGPRNSQRILYTIHLKGQ